MKDCYTCYKRVLHCLDLTRHSNGRRLLKVFSFLLILFVLCTGVLLSIDILSMPSDMNFWVGSSIAVYIWVVNLGQAILVWCARFSKDTRSVLKYYVIWTATLVPIMLPLLLYLKISFWRSKNLSWPFLLPEIILFSTFVLLKLYIMANIIRIYRKLGSTLINKWKQFQTHEDNLNNHFMPKLKPIEHLEHRYETVENSYVAETEPPVPNVRVSVDDFKAKVLSPLCLSIDKEKLIGEGQFGSVYKGTLRHRRQKKLEVAVKVVKNAERGDTFQLLLQEIKIAIAVGDHENIVNFYGISSDASMNAHFAIITEFCERGSLEIFLQENRHTFVNLLQQRGSIVYKDQQLYINLELHGTHSSMDLVRFAKQVALGMQHLSSKNIIHGDLAARNVLLTSNLTVKLTDFGMSRKLYTYQTYISGDFQEKECLPWRWMPVETLRDLKFSEKTDIYSFGVVLWEIFSLGNFPFEKLTWSSDILTQLEEGLTLERPAFASRDLFNIMKDCWSIDPQNRPRFCNIVELISDPKISNCAINMKTL